MAFRQTLSKVAADCQADRPELIEPRFPVIAATGAWGVQDWSTMKTYVDVVSPQTEDIAFLRAALAVRHEQYDAAKVHIDRVGEPDSQGQLNGCTVTGAHTARQRVVGDGRRIVRASV